MRRQIVVVMLAAAGLVAWGRVAAPSPPNPRWPAGVSQAAAAPSGQAPPALALGRPSAPSAPAPGGPGAPPPGEAPKVGAALAQSFRDDACACSTKACWRAASARYRSSVGLAVPQSLEEARAIDALAREASACIKRAYAAEAPNDAGPRP